MRLELRAAERTPIDGIACRSARLNSVVFAVEFEDVRSFAGMQFHPHNPLLAGVVTQIFFTAAIAASKDQTSTPALWIAPATNKFKPACSAKLRRRIWRRSVQQPMIASFSPRRTHSLKIPISAAVPSSTMAPSSHANIRSHERIPARSSANTAAALPGSVPANASCGTKHSIASARKRAAMLLNQSRSACEKSGPAR